MKRRMRMSLWGGLAAAALAFCVGFLWREWRGTDKAVRMERIRGEFAARRVNGSDWTAPPSRRQDVVNKVKSASPVSSDVDADELTEEEERLVDTIHDALHDEDLELSIELAKRAVSSKKPEVRSEMIDTLRFFGDKVLPELLMFIDDPDDGVKMDAMTAYEQAIFDIEDDREKAKVIEISMQNLNDADALEEIASELIGMDDSIAVQTLVNVIGGRGKTGQRIARETYETVTGEEYTTFEAAESWLREQQSDD